LQLLNRTKHCKLRDVLLRNIKIYYLICLMKNTIFYLSSCNSCKKVMDVIKPDKSFLLQDIKTEKITKDQIEEMAKLAGGYEPLFSKIAMKYRSMGLNEMKLSETDYKKYILEEYTFLKRPVIVFDNKIFIGSSKNSVMEAKNAIG
jgi:arsenate reductase (glutaredoxin)